MEVARRRVCDGGGMREGARGRVRDGGGHEGGGTREGA